MLVIAPAKLVVLETRQVHVLHACLESTSSLQTVAVWLVTPETMVHQEQIALLVRPPAKLVVLEIQQLHVLHAFPEGTY